MYNYTVHNHLAAALEGAYCEFLGTALEVLRDTPDAIDIVENVDVVKLITLIEKSLEEVWEQC